MLLMCDGNFIINIKIIFFNSWKIDNSFKRSLSFLYTKYAIKSNNISRWFLKIQQQKTFH